MAWEKAFYESLDDGSGGSCGVGLLHSLGYTPAN
jgi:hypothetical protein